jgi:hypothetical protein
MKSLQHHEIFGNWATLLLATDDHGNIDFSKLADEMDVLVSSRPNGIYSNGTAGEFYAQTEDEFDRIMALVGAGPMLVKNCVGRTSQYRLILLAPSGKERKRLFQNFSENKNCQEEFAISSGQINFRNSFF